MNRTINWDEILQLVFNATGETLYMVLLAGLFTLLIGLPLGVLLFVSRRDGLWPMPRLNAALGSLVNLGRSLPFVVMLIALIPLTRLLVGTTLGSTAAVVPITIGAFPFLRGSSRTRWTKSTRAGSKRSSPWAATSVM